MDVRVRKTEKCLLVSLPAASPRVEAKNQPETRRICSLGAATQQ